MSRRDRSRTRQLLLLLLTSFLASAAFTHFFIPIAGASQITLIKGGTRQDNGRRPRPGAGEKDEEARRSERRTGRWRRSLSVGGGGSGVETGGTDSGSLPGCPSLSPPLQPNPRQTSLFRAAAGTACVRTRVCLLACLCVLERGRGRERALTDLHCEQCLINS